MASVMVGQFFARDEEGRLYPVQEFRDAAEDAQDASTYRTAFGDTVVHVGGNEFELSQSSARKKLIRSD